MIKTILLSILFLSVVDIGFKYGFWSGLIALGVSYAVARIFGEV
jgi:hypothetical protein